MDIHEYQAKEILSRFGVPILRGGLAYSPEQAAYRAREIGGQQWVVKAQVHTGGRSTAGGVVLCNDDHAVHDAAERLFGSRLVTQQSGAAGKMVYRVYVESAASIAREMYIGFVLDRVSERIMVVASAAGGMEIEQISASEPDTIIRSIVEPAVGMQEFQAREIAFKLKIDQSLIKQSVDIIMGCYQAFEQLDATMVEINPLVITSEGALYALDAKMTFDDNALFRRPEVSELRDKSQEDASQTRAADRGLTYVGLDGNIACIVNGAGLAMATIDMIKQFGGSPANFLDIGGGATPERVAKALRLVLAERKVKAVLINVFAGINRCDWIAEGLVQALRKEPTSLPLVIRLAGTHVDEGRKILSQSGLPIIRANTLSEAADRVVKAVSAPVPDLHGVK